MQQAEILYCVDCDRPSMECRCREVCYHCGGSGTVVTCIDDICVGRGSCMHGDGESDCPECSGTGRTSPNRVEYEDLPEEVKV